MSSDENDIEISFHIQEFENDNQINFNIDELMLEIENTEVNYNLSISQMIHYRENYTIKELLLICEYYGFAKELKSNKYNKQQIIDFLVSFENDDDNTIIVFKRKQLWFYIDELKNDKFMKKFILW